LTAELAAIEPVGVVDGLGEQLQIHEPLILQTLPSRLCCLGLAQAAAIRLEKLLVGGGDHRIEGGVCGRRRIVVDEAPGLDGCEAGNLAGEDGRSVKPARKGEAVILVDTHECVLNAVVSVDLAPDGLEPLAGGGQVVDRIDVLVADPQVLCTAMSVDHSAAGRKRGLAGVGHRLSVSARGEVVFFEVVLYIDEIAAFVHEANTEAAHRERHLPQRGGRTHPSLYSSMAALVAARRSSARARDQSEPVEMSSYTSDSVRKK
jgi:hypothetical protein